MTSEQRLDRLERIAKLFVRAGLRARRNMQALDEKIRIIINNQIEHDDRFARMSQSIHELSQSMERSHHELSQSLNELAKAQIHTSGRLDALIEIVRRGRNGTPERSN